MIVYLIVPQRKKDLGRTTHPFEHCSVAYYSFGPRILVWKVALVVGAQALMELRMVLAMSRRVEVVGAMRSPSLPNFQKRRQPSQVIAATACPFYDRLNQQSLSSRQICLEAGTTLLG